jgi:hypothetical protein
MITRLLKVLEKRSIELSAYASQFINWDNGKTTTGIQHVPEKLEIDELIEELKTLEIYAVNSGARRKWVNIDTWLPKGCVMAMIYDEELAGKEEVTK